MKTRTVIGMAARDYRHEWLMSLCAVLGLAAVVAPLLILFGIKSGIVGTMIQRLVEDPRNREITLVGTGRFDAGWFERMAGRPEVAFVIAQTRSLAATMDLAAGHQVLSGVDLLPSAGGDPLLAQWAVIPVDEHVVLSASAARKLGVAAGAVLEGRVGRVAAGMREQVTVALTVAAVLPPEALGRDAMFAPLPLLVATEAYRDGYAVPLYEWAGKPPRQEEPVFASFRLYARSIDNVAGLAAELNRLGLEVFTRAEEIATVRALERGLNLLFWILAAVSTIGYFLATASSTLSNVIRKRRELGILGLIGVSGGAIVWFPMVQALLTALLGTATAAGLFFATAPVINGAFAGQLAAGEVVCRLGALDLGGALGMTAVVMLLAASFASIRVTRIDPSEVIRDV